MNEVGFSLDPPENNIFLVAQTPLKPLENYNEEEDYNTEEKDILAIAGYYVPSKKTKEDKNIIRKLSYSSSSEGSLGQSGDASVNSNVNSSTESEEDLDPKEDDVENQPLHNTQNLPRSTESDDDLEPNEDDVENQPLQVTQNLPPIGSAYKKYSTPFKSMVVQSKIRHGIIFASEIHHVPEGTIKSWIKKSNVLSDLSDQRKNNSRPIDLNFEKMLMDYIKELREKNLPVSGDMIRKKAINLKNKPGFRASCSWLKKFMIRNKLSFRKKTHIVQKLRETYQNKVLEYFEKLDSIQKKYGNNIVYINFDETPIYYDMSQDYTVEMKGKKQISVMSHPDSKHRLSACIGVTSQGDVLPLLAILLYRGTKNNKKKEKRLCPKKYEHLKKSTNPLMIRFNESGFNNEKLFLEWLNVAVKPFKEKHQNNNKKGIVLVVDDATFHSSENVKNFCKDNQIELLVLPGGTTSVLQPIDVVLNKPLRTK